MSEPGQTSASRQSRPDQVADLVWDRELAPDWFEHNVKSKRYLAVGVRGVMARLGIAANGAQQYFEQVEEFVRTKTAWRSQYPFVYECSNTQVREGRIKEARSFGKTAGLFIGLEIAARARGAEFDIYPNLKILCADYFVDQFNAERLEALRAYHEGLTPEDKLALFTDSVFAHQDLARFEGVCALAARQWVQTNPIRDLATGKTATHFVCDSVVKFVEKHYPAHLHVGPVRISGDPRSDQILGSSHASPNIHFPSSVSKLVKID